MQQQEGMSYGGDYKYIPTTSVGSGIGIEVLPDIYSYTIQIANICFVGDRDHFVLIDAGMPESAEEVIKACEERFGGNARPQAIILTHGHFDHIGAVIELVEQWQIPVYAHSLERPYLTGQQSYPEPDSGVEGGMVAKMSGMFPIEPINLGSYLKDLPEDGSVPEMTGWEWIHTPGHSPGHISLFRSSDRALIVGDVTVKQDELYKVLNQTLEINGPPRYLTTDWRQAKESVKSLLELKSAVAVTGHGQPVSGQTLAEDLMRLVDNFDSLAVPDYGKFVDGEH